MKHRLTHLLSLLALLVAGLLAAPSAQAQVRPHVTDIEPVPKALLPTAEDICQLHPGPYVKSAAPIMPDPDAPKSAPVATINVTYNGFTPQAQAAFQRAIDIWETHIQSPVTINVQANFTNLGSGVLGSARPANSYFGTVNGERSIYGVALLEAILGRDLNAAGAADIVTNFNSNFSNWHFGSGPTGSSDYDFTTVVLHELGHGLNFTGTMQVNGGVGSWGLGSGEPGIYDQFTQNSFGTALTDETVFPNPSTALGDALTSNDVFFDGPLANRASQQNPGPTPPKLYAPAVWNPGSSYSHVDEATYPSGNVDALMTPQIGRGQTARLPGPIVCGMFGDMGWPLGPDCASVIPVELTAFDAVASGDGTVTLTWETASETNNAGFGIEQRAPGQPAFQEVGFVNGAGTTTAVQRYRFRANAPSAGRYVFRLRQVDFDGTTDYSPTVEVTVGPQGAYALVAAGPNPFRSRTAVELVVREAQQVRAQLYNVLGQRVATVFAGEVRPAEATRLEVQAQGLASGVYLMRVVGERFATTRRLTVVR